MWDAVIKDEESPRATRKLLHGGGGAGDGCPPKEGGRGLEKWASLPGPLFV